MRKLEVAFSVGGVLLMVILIKWIADAGGGTVIASSVQASSQGSSTRVEVAGAPAGDGRAPADESGSAAEDDESAEAEEETEMDERSLYLIELVEDEEMLKTGRTQYEMYCLACHGDKEPVAEGSPSYLFDAEWHHGEKPVDIEAVIRKGDLDTGMPGWEGMLSDDEIAAVVAYLLANNRES